MIFSVMSAFCSRVIFSNSLTFFQIPTSPSHRPPPLMTLPWDPVAGDPSAALDRALPIGGTPGDRPIKPSDGGRGPREGSNACSCVSTFVCPPCGAPSLSCLCPSPAVPESRLESPGEGGGGCPAHPQGYWFRGLRGGLLAHRAESFPLHGGIRSSTLWRKVVGTAFRLL